MSALRRGIVHPQALLLWALLWTAVSCTTPALAEVDITQCGSLQQRLGPFDYRTASASIKREVEGAHWDDPFDAFLKGKKYSPRNGNIIMADFDYTLRAFPNHHDALRAINLLGVWQKTENPEKARWTLECYYLRGMKFAPDDALVYLAYGEYLQRRGRTAEARKKIDQAVGLLAAKGGGSAITHYNLGLAYFDFGEFDLAQSYAESAAKGGVALPGLRVRLQRSGHWKERKAEVQEKETTAADHDALEAALAVDAGVVETSPAATSTPSVGR